MCALTSLALKQGEHNLPLAAGCRTPGAAVRPILTAELQVRAFGGILPQTGSLLGGTHGLRGRPRPRRNEHPTQVGQPPPPQQLLGKDGENGPLLLTHPGRYPTRCHGPAASVGHGAQAAWKLPGLGSQSLTACGSPGKVCNKCVCWGANSSQKPQPTSGTEQPLSLPPPACHA